MKQKIVRPYPNWIPGFLVKWVIDWTLLTAIGFGPAPWLVRVIWKFKNPEWIAQHNA